MLFLMYILLRNTKGHDIAIAITIFILALSLITSNVVDAYKLFKGKEYDRAYIKSDMIYLAITTEISIILAIIFLPMKALLLLLTLIIIIPIVYILVSKLDV